MTVEELAYAYGTKNYVCSVNSSLRSICLSIYKSFEENYQRVLLELNNIYDWENVPALSTIRYIPSVYLSELEMSW